MFSTNNKLAKEIKRLESARATTLESEVCAGEDRIRNSPMKMKMKKKNLLNIEFTAITGNSEQNIELIVSFSTRFRKTWGYFCLT